MKVIKRIALLLLLISVCLFCVACVNVNVTGEVNTHSNASGAAQGSSDLTDDEYTNSFFRFACDVPDDWYIYDKADLLEVSGVVTDMLEDSDYGDLVQKDLDNGVSIIDFYANSPDTTQMLNIVVNKSNFIGMFLSERQQLEASIETTRNMIEQIGASNITATTEIVSFLGKHHAALRIQGEFPVGSLYETIFLLRWGPYNAVVTASSLLDDNTDTILGYCRKLD